MESSNSKNVSITANCKNSRKLTVFLSTVLFDAYFLSVVEPMYQSILTNTIENQRLAAFRDTLLPKLMSGEIDVSNVTI